MLYYAEAELAVDGGIMITGSHNPADYNGFKMVFSAAPSSARDIKGLGAMAAAGDWETGEGSVTDEVVIDRYVERLMQGFDGERLPDRLGRRQRRGGAGARAAARQAARRASCALHRTSTRASPTIIRTRPRRRISPI